MPPSDTRREHQVNSGTLSRLEAAVTDLKHQRETTIELVKRLSPRRQKTRRFRFIRSNLLLFLRPPPYLRIPPLTLLLPFLFNVSRFPLQLRDPLFILTTPKTSMAIPKTSIVILKTSTISTIPSVLRDSLPSLTIWFLPPERRNLLRHLCPTMTNSPVKISTMTVDPISAPIRKPSKTTPRRFVS